jgi:hypothetical protein
MPMPVGMVRALGHHPLAAPQKPCAPSAASVAWWPKISPLQSAVFS